LRDLNDEEVKAYREQKYKIHGEWIEEQKRKKDLTLSRLDDIYSSSLKEQYDSCNCHILGSVCVSIVVLRIKWIISV
jgi:hypothetical protein